jgi:hypothetical protein
VKWTEKEGEREREKERKREREREREREGERGSKRKRPIKTDKEGRNIERGEVKIKERKCCDEERVSFKECFKREKHTETQKEEIVRKWKKDTIKNILSK